MVLTVLDLEDIQNRRRLPPGYSTSAEPDPQLWWWPVGRICFAIREHSGYLVGSDIGTDVHCMGWVRDEICRAVPGEIMQRTGYTDDRARKTAVGRRADMIR